MSNSSSMTSGGINRVILSLAIFTVVLTAAVAGFIPGVTCRTDRPGLRDGME